MFHFVRCPAPSGTDRFDRTSQRSYLHLATCSAHALQRLDIMAFPSDTDHQNRDFRVI